MKTIIAATDFSAVAANAVIYASDMAAAIGAGVMLVHVWKLPMSYSGMVTPVLADDLMQDARQDMNTLKNSLAGRYDGRVSFSSRIVAGDFFAELEKICSATNPYMVVLGSQGTTASERAIFGGHTVNAMKHLNWPVITVPLHASFSQVNKIGIACDLKNIKNDMPLQEIVRLAKDFNAGLHIINTGKEEVFDPGVVFQSGVMAGKLADVKPCYHFIASDDADEGIMEFAEKNKIDLLVVLPKHHGWFDNLIHKSHTKQLVLHSQVPVMALHTASTG